MGRSHLRTYTSHKPVGLIYRATKNTNEKPLLMNHCLYDPRLYVEDMYKYIVDARKTKAKYDHSLRILLGQYAVKTEVEFVSGHIVHWPKYLGKQHRSEFCERVKAAFSRFRRYWKKEFDSTLIRDNTIHAQVEAKAAAWYYVTYHPSEYNTDVLYNSTLSRYMSFPWVVDNHITCIANKNANRPPLDEFIQPIPQEKIENYARLMSNKTIFSHSEDDHEDYKKSEEGNGVGNSFEQRPINLQLVSDHNLSHNDDFHTENGEDEVPVVNIKLSDLLLKF
jgi:hypothetical protein